MCNQFCFDTAVGEIKGKRRTQEDFVFANFPENANAGLAVLSDGMGGHHNSVIASKFLVTGVAGELSMELENFADIEDKIPEMLGDVTRFANVQLGSFIRQRRIKSTIGATLLSVAISRDKLFWASVGDSLLYVFRDGELRRLNADHSMSPQIDFMVEAGMISEEKAKDHPDRSILTSAIYGRSITRIDCPEDFFQLRPSDIVILASDGIDTLNRHALSELLTKNPSADSGALVGLIMSAIDAADHSDQDNTALAVIKVENRAEKQKSRQPKVTERPATPWSMPEICAPAGSDVQLGVTPTGPFKS